MPLGGLVILEKNETASTSNSQSWLSLFAFRSLEMFWSREEEGGRAHLHETGKTPRARRELRRHIGASSAVPRVGRQKRKKKGLQGNGEGNRGTIGKGMERHVEGHIGS